MRRSEQREGGKGRGKGVGTGSTERWFQESGERCWNRPTGGKCKKDRGEEERKKQREGRWCEKDEKRRVNSGSCKGRGSGG